MRISYSHSLNHNAKNMSNGREEESHNKGLQTAIAFGIAGLIVLSSLYIKHGHIGEKCLRYQGGSKINKTAVFDDKPLEEREGPADLVVKYVAPKDAAGFVIGDNYLVRYQEPRFGNDIPSLLSSSEGCD